jgi:hypothetical protein
MQLFLSRLCHSGPVKLQHLIRHVVHSRTAHERVSSHHLRTPAGDRSTLSGGGAQAGGNAGHAADGTSRGNAGHAAGRTAPAEKTTTAQPSGLRSLATEALATAGKAAALEVAAEIVGGPVVTGIMLGVQLMKLMKPSDLHDTPGRKRVRCPGLEHDTKRRAAVEKDLRAMDGCGDISYTAAGSIVVRCKPGSIQMEQVLDVLGRHGCKLPGAAAAAKPQGKGFDPVRWGMGQAVSHGASAATRLLLDMF